MITRIPRSLASPIGTHPVILLVAAAIALLACCAKDPCLKQWGCSDCNCLFDKTQSSQNDLATMAEIQECYDRACK